MSIFFLALKDFFSYEFLKYTLIPFIISLLVFSILAFFAFDSLQAFIASVFKSNSLLAWFYSFSIFEIFLDILTFLGALMSVLFLSVFVSIFVSSFFTAKLIKLVFKKHYDLEIPSEASMLSVSKIGLKICLKSLVLFIICLVLLFIPMLNILGFYLFFYYLYSSFLLLDVSASCLDEKVFKAFWQKPSRLSLRVILASFYVLSSVPLLGLFIQGFFIIYLGHYFAISLKEKKLLVA